MSGISTGIGLVSGIDTASLIEQLMAIERRPINTLQTRVGVLDTQRTAFIELSAQLLALQNSALGFSRPSFFHRFSSTSSHENVLTANAGETALPGSHTFRVRSLVTSHSLISRGFADPDSTPIGSGRLTIESREGKVRRDTELGTLNGGTGVRRGVITITDRSGASADIDLSTALTINDVLEAINDAAEIRVRASVTGVTSNGVAGDRIVLEDLTVPAEVVGELTIADPRGGFTAVDLGIANGVASGVASDRIDGRDLVRLSESTLLSLLNDGNGVGHLRVGSDLEFTTRLSGSFSVSLSGSSLVQNQEISLRALNSGNGVRLGIIRITDRSGQSAEIDLTDARTLRDILDRINAADVNVNAMPLGIDNETVVMITDGSDAPDNEINPPKLIIEDITGSTAADLGLAGEFADDSIQGHGIYRVETIGDVINAINFAPGNAGVVEASISDGGNGIVLRAVGLNNTLTVTAGSTGSGDDRVFSSALQDLGLVDAVDVTSFESRHLVAGLNTVLLDSLNGGKGVGSGTVEFVDREGHAATIDLAGAHTVQDVVDLINLEPSLSLVASVNASGNGIVVRDESDGTGMISILDVDGTTAADLGLAGTHEGVDRVDGGNLQVQYITRRSVLEDLNDGRGVTLGTFQITDSNGGIHVVNMNPSARTIGDVIDSINRVTQDAVEARINDTGDGIVLVDNLGGNLPLTIEDRDGGRTALDLGIDGSARSGENFVDGSFEVSIEIGAGDTLQDVARKINESRAAVSASILGDGSSVNPFSMTITSEVSGRAGELVVDAIGVDLGFSTLSRPQDAVVTLGDDGGAVPRLVSSSTNTLEGVIPGVTLDLLSVSDENITINIAKDEDAIVESLQSFADSYNGVLDTIDRLTAFNTDTFERGPLLGDSTVNTVRNRLRQVMLRRVEGVDESLSRLFSVGLRLGEGNRMSFDEERFREVYAESPQRVEEFFTKTETGFADVLQGVIESLTEKFDGLITRKDDLLEKQQELLNKRIDDLNVLLEAKRARLQTQFVALESSLLALQSQQFALDSLSQLTR